MARSPSVFGPLDAAADAVIAESGNGGTEGKRGVLDALADGLGFLGNAVSVLHCDLADAGYGPGFCDPIWRVRQALASTATLCADAMNSLSAEEGT